MSAAPTLRRRVSLPRVDPVRLAGGLVGSAATIAVVVMGAIVAVDSAYYRSIVVPISEKKGYPFWMKGPLQTFAGDLLLADQYGRLMVAIFFAYVVVILLARWVPLPVIVGGIVILHVLFVLTPPVGSTDV